MKSAIIDIETFNAGPAPHRAGGLKFQQFKSVIKAYAVPPPTGRVD